MLLIDANHRIIASSDGAGVLNEKVRLVTNNSPHGFYVADDGATIAFHATPGYETYRGLGWYGVIIQRSS